MFIVSPPGIHISLGICVRGYTYHGDTHITVTPAPSAPRDFTLLLHHSDYVISSKVFNLIHASQMFLCNDFPLVLKLLVQIASAFSAKYVCRRNSSPKAFFQPLFKARPQFQPDQDSGNPVQVYGLLHNAMT